MKMKEIRVGHKYALSDTNDIYSDPNVRCVTVLEIDVLIEVRNAGVRVRTISGKEETVHSRRLKMEWGDFVYWTSMKNETRKAVLDRISNVQAVLDKQPFDAMVVDPGGSAGDVRVSILANDFILLMNTLRKTKIGVSNGEIKDT